MSSRIAERVAVISTTLGVCGAVFLPFVYEARAASAPSSIASTVTLTAVASTGTWTDQDVSGWNYWTRDFPAARPVLPLGETTRLRLKSSDVTHSLYVPDLGIGPVTVQPGHVVEIAVTPMTEGVFRYYCTTVCGHPHWGMQGEVAVQPRGTQAVPVQPRGIVKYWLEPPPPQDAGPIGRGKWLFRQQGCFLCHGPEGQGGVVNRNYVKDTIPPLNLAERMMLFESDDVNAILDHMKRGTRLEALADSPPVPRFNVFLAQYHSVEDVIRNGSVAGKKDPKGVTPPLKMPAWGQQLSDANIDAIVAYLLTLQPSK